MARSITRALVKIQNAPNRRHGLTPFEIVFGCPMPTGISEPSVCWLCEHCGDLSEQFDALTSCTLQLTSMVEAYHQ